MFLMELALIALPLQPDLFMNHHHMLSILECGLDAGPLRVFSSMARILHPGDYVYLLMRSTGAATSVVSNYQAVVTYAAKWNWSEN